MPVPPPASLTSLPLTSCTSSPRKTRWCATAEVRFLHLNPGETGQRAGARCSRHPEPLDSRSAPHSRNVHRRQPLSLGRRCAASRLCRSCRRRSACPRRRCRQGREETVPRAAAAEQNPVARRETCPLFTRSSERHARLFALPVGGAIVAADGIDVIGRVARRLPRSRRVRQVGRRDGTVRRVGLNDQMIDCDRALAVNPDNPVEVRRVSRRERRLDMPCGTRARRARLALPLLPALRVISFRRAERACKRWRPCPAPGRDSRTRLCTLHAARKDRRASERTRSIRRSPKRANRPFSDRADAADYLGGVRSQRRRLRVVGGHHGV